MTCRAAILLVVLLCMPATAARADIGFGIGFGAPVWGGRLDDIRIGAVARDIIDAYLHAEYSRLCPADRPPVQAETCKPARPFYRSGYLPLRGDDLPPDILQKIGFVPPGTAYRQIGFSVYLVRLPDRRIYDSRSLWNDGWN